MVWSTNLRFNLDKSPYREAYGYLKNMDRKAYKSINKVVAIIVCEHFKRLEKSKNEPYFETWEREDRIVEAVKTAVEKAMPSFMVAYITAKLTNISSPVINDTVSENSVLKEGISDTAADDIDFDFVGE